VSGRSGKTGRPVDRLLFTSKDGSKSFAKRDELPFYKDQVNGDIGPIILPDRVCTIGSGRCAEQNSQLKGTIERAIR
jgi:hypothetical protein